MDKYEYDDKEDAERYRWIRDVAKGVVKCSRYMNDAGDYTLIIVLSTTRDDTKGDPELLNHIIDSQIKNSP